MHNSTFKITKYINFIRQNLIFQCNRKSICSFVQEQNTNSVKNSFLKKKKFLIFFFYQNLVCKSYRIFIGIHSANVFLVFWHRFWWIYFEKSQSKHTKIFVVTTNVFVPYSVAYNEWKKFTIYVLFDALDAIQWKREEKKKKKRFVNIYSAHAAATSLDLHGIERIHFAKSRGDSHKLKR